MQHVVSDEYGRRLQTAYQPRDKLRPAVQAVAWAAGLFLGDH